MNEQPVDREALLASLPPRGREDVWEALRTLIRRVDRKVIVLDDDPTGTQTVHDIPVVTRWSVDHLARELADPAPASCVLTNSRSLSDPNGEGHHEAGNVSLARRLHLWLVSLRRWSSSWGPPQNDERSRTGRLEREKGDGASRQGRKRT